MPASCPPELENPNFVRGGFGRVSTNSNRARNNNNNSSSNNNRDSLPPLEGESYNLIEEAEVATSHVSGGGEFSSHNFCFPKRNPLIDQH